MAEEVKELYRKEDRIKQVSQTGLWVGLCACWGVIWQVVRLGMLLEAILEQADTHFCPPIVSGLTQADDELQQQEADKAKKKKKKSSKKKKKAAKKAKQKDAGSVKDEL